MKDEGRKTQDRRPLAVVWDAVGNVTWGMRGWDEYPPLIQAQFLREDPTGRARIQTIETFLAPHAVVVHKVSNADELDACIAEADFLITHKVNVPSEVLRKGKRLRLVQHLGLDYRGIPLDAIAELGVPLAAVPMVNYLAVAEHSWALILNHLKRLPQTRPYMQRREYVDRWGLFPPGLQLARDCTLGLLGFGEIARPMARIAKAFDMRVIFWDIARFPEIEQAYGVEWLPWDEVFKQADILSVHLALNDQTHKIIGEREIGLMKPTAFFVNTARGRLVDQPALVRALQERRLGGAGLDVFYEEPLPVDDPLHALHEDLSYHVTLTPHDAWQSVWTHVRDSQAIWGNVKRVLNGEPIAFRVA
ncbi:MAG: glycerate dehydrogenase [Candidatus Roseilinea sp.]|nr:MAG: glycerate dehydrogenase [Candidatus Roseilinea sp.]